MELNNKKDENIVNSQNILECLPSELITDEIIIQFMMSSVDYYDDDIKQLNVLRSLNKRFKEIIGKSKKISDFLNSIPEYYTENSKKLADILEEIEIFDDGVTDRPVQVFNDFLELIKNGADPKMEGYFCNTILHVAAYQENWEIQKLFNLIKKKKDCTALLNSKDSFGDTPLHVAVKKGFLHIVEILVANGANIYKKNNGNETPLDLAENDAVIAFLLSNEVKKGKFEV